MRTATSRNNLTTIGKYGFSMGPGLEAAVAWRYFRLGENSLMINGQTRTFNKKLNSSC